MDKDQLYTEHMDEMFGITSLDNLTEENVDRIITRDYVSYQTTEDYISIVLLRGILLNTLTTG